MAIRQILCTGLEIDAGALGADQAAQMFTTIGCVHEASWGLATEGVIGTLQPVGQPCPGIKSTAITTVPYDRLHEADQALQAH